MVENQPPKKPVCATWLPLSELIFDHEAGGEKFLQNMDSRMDYTEL
jgi:hypothetical protein